MKKLYVLIVLVLLAVNVPVSAAPVQSNQVVALQPGQSVEVNCPTQLQAVTVQNNKVVLVCKGLAPTNTATNIPAATNTTAPTSSPTMPMPTNTGMPQSDAMMYWHAPGTHDGLNVHEHGDKPPQWAEDFSMANFSHPIMYGGDERSSDTENVMKHQSFKGAFWRHPSGAEIYFRYHAASNPMDRAAAFHSYEIYVKDVKGNISFNQGVYFSGYPEFRSQRMTRRNEVKGTLLPDGSVAPGRDQYIIGSPDRIDWFGLEGNLQTRCEQWYLHGGYQAWDFSITICGASTFFSYDEHLTNVMDMSTWKLTGSTGLYRRFELTSYPNPRVGGIVVPKDKWYCFSAKPKEDKVEGFTHRPKWTVTGAVANANACPAGFLPQYQASTFVPIYFETGNTFEKTYPGNGVTIPN